MLSSSVSSFPSLSKTHRSNVLSKSFVFAQGKKPGSKQFIFKKNIPFTSVQRNVCAYCFCKYGQQYWRGKCYITYSCVVASSSQTLEVEKNIFCPCTDLTLGFLWLQPHVCGGKGWTCLPSFRCPCVKSQITVRGKPRNSLPLVWHHHVGWVANRSPFLRFCCGGGWLVFPLLMKYLTAK